MKRVLSCFLIAVFMVLLTACGAKTDIAGIWEQEMETTILGREEAASVPSLCRFTFREDGTGIQENIFSDGSYPNVVREFTWNLEVDTLALEYNGNHTEKFIVLLTKSSLKLENNRGVYDLTRVE